MGSIKDWVIDMFWQTKHFFSELWYKIRHGIPYGFSQLFYYGPTVWNDPSFDYSGLLYLMRRKLKQLEVVIRDGYHVDCEKDADRIKIVLDALDRLIADDYLFEEEKKVNEKWGESTMSSKPTENPTLRELVFERSGIKTEEDEEQCRKEMKIVFKKAGEKEKEDYRFVFDTLRDHLKEWWD